MAWRIERRRLFFALWPDEGIRRSLYKETRPAVHASGGKPVSADNFHITIAFLGQLDAEATALAEVAAAAVAGARFDLVLDRVGFWPGAGVLWFRPSVVPEAGARFAADLRQELRARDIRVDVHPFMPHVTLTRKCAKSGNFGLPRPVAWPVREFVLMHSVTGQRASEYHPVGAWPMRAVGTEL